MSNFKVGEKVVCLVPKSSWIIGEAVRFITKIRKMFGKVRTNGPDTNEIVTIIGIFQRGSHTALKLKEYDDGKGSCYDHNCFRKCDYEFAEEVIKNLIEQETSIEI